MIEPTPLSSNSQNINASPYLNSAKYLKGTDIRAIKEDIDRHLPIRDIAKKYHILFSVYSQIKNSAMDKAIQKETMNPDEPPKKETVKNNEPVSTKTSENNETSETGIVNEKYTNREVLNDNILDIKPSPRIKPKKFLFPRIGKENTLLITYRGRFYFEYILPDFPKEMQDELAESIADCVIQFIQKHKETSFTIIRTDRIRPFFGRKSR